MKNTFRTLGVSFFLSACMLFALSFFKIISVAEPTQTATPSSSVTTSNTSQPTESSQASATTPTTQQNQPATTQSTSQRPSEKVSFTVNSDDTSYSVAERLLESGVIQSVDDFNNYMLNNDLSQYIQTGTFDLRQNMSLEELGQTLTTYPGN